MEDMYALKNGYFAKSQQASIDQRGLFFGAVLRSWNSELNT